ncbi:MAG: hypothetical protein EZS28_023632 [Streblomastix strix]|uniref:Uncharacterized protein n=1 Tax=Streblomastix strix TaxID=222440 RepID=A0A5J4VE88_9EUKA|nr:MAG: hypothetical protein EZS28_023632 [Streblomastix strix]
MPAKKIQKVAPVKLTTKPKTRVSEFIDQKKAVYTQGLISPGSSKQRKEIIGKVKQYDPNITHGDIEAAFEGMKGATRRELDRHICGVHDPLQGVYRDAAMGDQSQGLNARAIELANDIGNHAISQPSLRATAPPKGIHKEDELMNFICV